MFFSSNGLIWRN